MATIQKRKDSYKITVSLGYAVDGKHIRRTKTYKPGPDMTPKQIEKEVQRQAVLFEEQCRSGQSATDGRIKLDDYIPMYLQNAQTTMSATTYVSYQRIIKNYISPALGHLKMKDIKPVHVQSFVNQLQTMQADTKSGKLTPSTVRRYFTVLQSIFHSAYKLGIIGTNPTDADRITLPKLKEQTTEIFTADEIQQIFKALENEPLLLKTLIHLAINTGCRRGELVALKWSDLDFDTNVLTIQRSNYKLTGSQIESKETKSGKSRKITLSSYCMELLRHYKAEQARYALSLGDKWQHGNWIFTQAEGQPMYPSTPTDMFSRFLKRNNITHRKFHALRHTSATLLLSSGTNIKNVASRLGHSQLKTTDRYVHAIEEADRQAANTFDTLFTATTQTHTA